MTTEPLSEVERARAELTTTLNFLEDKFNLPKRAKRLRETHPGALAAAVAGTVVAIGGVVWLGLRAARRR